MGRILILACCLLWVPRLCLATISICPDFTQFPSLQTARVWSVSPPISQPDGLRPCCAFGYALKAKLLGFPVPFYRVDNVVEADNLGEHHYNDSVLSAFTTLAGLSREHNGIVYTRRGGFIDISHVRDSADMTFYLFTHIWPQFGRAMTIELDDELARRRIILYAFTPPADSAKRFILAASLSAYLAFQIAAWHEIAQWYGFQSVKGFSEEVSAFSPEDLYSNVLGARLSLSLILKNHISSTAEFNHAMPTILRDALHKLGAVSAHKTRKHFDDVDRHLWDSRRYLPEKFLVLTRNYDTGDSRFPTPISGETATPLALMLPHIVEGISLSSLGELELWPGKHMARLPKPNHYYTFRDFLPLAHHAQQQDDIELFVNQIN